MKRRILVEVEPNEEWPDSMLEILSRIAWELDRQKEEKLLVDYGVALENDMTWFVKLTANVVKGIAEVESPRVLKDPARSYKKIPGMEGAKDEG